MLLCLSNIGDIMATSFRFLYWRVCCYVCTKKPKKKKFRSNRSLRASNPRSRTASFRRSMRTSQRTTDSGYGLSEIGPCSHSDTELRYFDEGPTPRDFIQRTRYSQQSRFSDSNVPPPRGFPNNTPRNQLRGGSLDRRKVPKSLETSLDPALLAKSPVLCNKYVVNENQSQRQNIGNHVVGPSK